MQTTVQYLQWRLTLTVMQKYFYRLYNIGLGLWNAFKTKKNSRRQMSWHRNCKCWWLHGETLPVNETREWSNKLHLKSQLKQRPQASSFWCHLNAITVHFSIQAVASLLCTMSTFDVTWQVAYVKKPILAASKSPNCARNHKLEGIS